MPIYSCSLLQTSKRDSEYSSHGARGCEYYNSIYSIYLQCVQVSAVGFKWVHIRQVLGLELGLGVIYLACPNLENDLIMAQAHAVYGPLLKMQSIITYSLSIFGWGGKRA